MKNTIIYIACLISVIACKPKESIQTISSPDNNISFSLIIENGSPYYKVEAFDKNIIDKSPLGFELKGQEPLASGFELIASSEQSFDETWKTVVGQSSEIKNHYNEAVWELREKEGLKRNIKIIARSYNDGVAFRYILPEWPNTDSLLITKEKTGFRFASDHKAWWIPQDEFAYESLHQHTLLSEIPAANTPITIETNDSLFICIHEAALLDYSEMTLIKDSSVAVGFNAALWPEPDGVCARLALPFKSPWRSIIISKDAGGLIESNLILNLNEPCALEDVSWIKPMKFVGIWWGMHIGKYTWTYGDKHGATTQRTKEYIDFAARHGIEGVLAEGWNLGWETWATDKQNIQDFTKAYPDFDLKEVVRYAKEKNVKFISHHETGCNIPEYEKQMEEAFALCKEMGIQAVKTGYAGVVSPEGYHHHGQYMVRHFQKVVETAAKYHIMLDVHEGIKPTGLERTWPNLMSTEAIRGNETNGGYKATPPYHHTILPFTRFIAGPADFTPGIFNIIHSPESNRRLYCTLSNQLALFVVMYSPMMMVSDMIENYENHPAFQFLKEVPASWDETRVLNVKPGDYVVIARRKGHDWFLGGVADENCYQFKIPLSFLPDSTKWEAQIYSDALQTDWEKTPTAIDIQTYSTTGIDTIEAALAKAGGIAVHFKPVNKIAEGVKPIKDYNINASEKLKIFNKLKTYGSHDNNHLAKGKLVSLKNPFSFKYPSSGKNALTDGRIGSYNYSDGSWQGFEGTDLEAIIDLGYSIPVNEITIDFLYSPNDWIFLPEKVSFFTSADGINYTNIGDIKYENPKPKNINIVKRIEASQKLENQQIRYIRVIATSIKTCPGWHYGKGQKAWLFAGEIIVK